MKGRQLIRKLRAAGVTVIPTHGLKQLGLDPRQIL
jgi:predicted nuclease with RNAse H fold